MTGEYPTQAVRAVIDAALADSRRRRPRRTKREIAADKLVDAIVALREAVDDLEPADAVALDDARAVAEKYRED